LKEKASGYETPPRRAASPHLQWSIERTVIAPDVKSDLLEAVASPMEY